MWLPGTTEGRQYVEPGGIETVASEPLTHPTGIVVEYARKPPDRPHGADIKVGPRLTPLFEYPVHSIHVRSLESFYLDIKIIDYYLDVKRSVRSPSCPALSTCF